MCFPVDKGNKALLISVHLLFFLMNRIKSVLGEEGWVACLLLCVLPTLGKQLQIY